MRKKRTIFNKPKTKDNLLSSEETEAMLKGAMGLKERLVVHVPIFTGMRISELIHMRGDWINWRDQMISIPESQPCDCRDCREPHFDEEGRVTKPPETWQPKTRDSVRSIPIVPEISGLLWDYFSKHKTVMETVPSRGSAWYHFRKATKRAGIGHPVFPHAARGTHATILARSDFNPFELKDAMGWKKIATAEDYIKLSGRQVKRAYDEKWKGVR